MTEDLRFTPSDRMLDLLIGENLYAQPSACVRELLQNASDACDLQKAVDPSYSPSITMRFSIRENWIEVEDDGLGMNSDSLRQSFAAVGASKTEVSHIKEIIQNAT